MTRLVRRVGYVLIVGGWFFVVWLIWGSQASFVAAMPK